MKNRTIQMELLSEVRTPAQVQNFALSREQGQENQREILRSSTPNWNNQVGAIPKNCTRKKIRQQKPAQQTNTNKELCWSCGGIFIPGHINQCTAKPVQGSICKKTGHFAKMWCSKIPPIPSRRNQQRGGYQRPQGQNQSQLRIRQIQENLIEEEQ